MKPTLNHLKTFSVGTLVTIAAGASTALAQEDMSRKLQLEEVIVTAEKREQNVQDMPLSVTAFSQREMDMRDATDMRALQNYTPNLEFNNESGGQNNTRITLRGIGTETLVGGGDPGVALHVDGVYIGRNSATAQKIFDVERLEVLRGPQGTLYGRNATGGSINIITKNPSEEFEAFGDLTAGNYNRQRARGVLNVPLSDTFFARASVLSEKRDGYLENQYPGGDDADDLDTTAIRGKLLWEMGDDNRAILGGYYNKNQGAGGGSRFLGSDTDYQFTNYLTGISDGSSGPPAGAPIAAPLYARPASGAPALPMSTDIHEINKNAKEKGDITQQGVDLTVEWNLSSELMLRSISAYGSNDNKALVDADNSELDIEERKRDNEATQWSQEFNLLSSGDGSLEWILGAFYYHEEIDEDFSTLTPGGLLDPSINLPGGQLPGGNGVGQSPSAHYEADSYALFGQGTYTLLDDLRFTAGLRYSWDDKQQSRTDATIIDLVTGYQLLGGGATGHTDDSVVANWSKWTGKVGVDYDLNESSMLYATFSRGYKSGGIPFNGVMDPYEPEEIDAYEIGSKNELFDNRARLNLVAFYYDYKDLQVFRLTGDGPRAENAAQSTVWGAEAEFQVILTENLSLDGSAGYLNAEYDEYSVDLPVYEDYSGNKLNHAPEYMFNIGAQYELALWGGDITTRLDYARRGDTYYDRANGPFDKQEAYGLINANVRFERDNWYVAMYGKNLGDEDYVTGQIINPPFNCDCRTVGVGEPLTFGLEVGYSMD